MSRIVIISGSHRQNSESRRIADYLEKRCQNLLASSATVLDVAKLDLPLWDEEVWNGGEPWKTILPPVHKVLNEASGFLIVSPEWAGMVPSGLKNLLLLCSPDQLGHKPAMLVGVSSGRGGAYPVNELRSSGYKNNKLAIMPDHLIVRDCENMLKADEPDTKEDIYMRERIDWSLQVLDLYVKSFEQMRQQGSDTLFAPEYANGM